VNFIPLSIAYSYYKVVIGSRYWAALWEDVRMSSVENFFMYLTVGKS